MSELGSSPSSASLVQSYLSGGAKSIPDLGIRTAPGTAAGGSNEKEHSLRAEDLLRVAPPGEESAKSAESAAANAKPSIHENKTQTAESETETHKPDASAREKLQVTDSKGRKVEIDIDFSNRESVKKAFQDAHNFQNGFRKMQLERDQLKTQLDKRLSELEPVKRNFDLLDKAYQKSGVEGVIDLLEAAQGGYKNWFDSKLKQHEFRQTASPEELRALDAREEAAKYSKQEQALKKEFDEFKKSVEAERNQAEVMRMEAKVQPLLGKYGFTGKLGDATEEEFFNGLLWDKALSNLEKEYGDKSDIQITPEIIEDELRVISATLRKRIQNQVSKKTTQVIEKKKQDALENVQTQVKSDYADNGGKLRAEADNLLNNGNVAGLISGWKKFSPLFGNTRK